MTGEMVFQQLREEFDGLQRSSHLMGPLLDGLDLGLAVITSDFHVIYANSRMREWFPGVDMEGFPRCHEVFHNRSDQVCPDCPAAAALESGEKRNAILELAAGDGVRYYKVSCAPLKGEDGSAWGVLSVVEHVTAEVLQNRKMQTLEWQYLQFLENARDAIISFRRNGEIVQINKKAQEQLGYSAEEALGKSVLMLIPEEIRDVQATGMKEILFNRQNDLINRVLEGQLLHHDGHLVPFEATFSVQSSDADALVTAIIRDISERKNYEKRLRTQAEELQSAFDESRRELARTEERYRVLVETANDAIFSVNTDGSLVYCNRKTEELFGYSRSELLGVASTVIVPGGLLELVAREYRPVAGELYGKVVESVGLKKDATQFPVEYTISVFEQDGDRTLTFIARDITRRKQLEQELQQYTATLEEKVRERTYALTASQQDLKEKISELSILKEISEALASAMELDDVLNIILVGATSHHGLGFNRAFLFLVSDDGLRLEGRVAIGPSDGAEAQRIWTEIVGKKLTLREILKTYTNRSGEIDTQVNAVIKNISIPLDAEHNILVRVLTDQQSCNVQNAFSDPMVSRDLLSIMNCNAFALIPLVVEDRALGVLWADNAITRTTIQDRDIERLRAFALNASLAIQQSNLYKRIREKVEALDEANRELKENRDRLIRTEKLAAVGEMSATVAHGLRNPLVSIGGFARRLLKKEACESPSRKYLQIIVEEIDRLETILSELLDFVRPKKLYLKEMAVGGVIDATLEVFQIEFERKNVTVARRYGQDLPLLSLDADQFKRVLHNLFNNALEAMPQGGCLEISAGREEDWVKISIADTGQGINDNDIEKVFHPFFTSKPTGSGLGLAVCNQIISIHGGHITLRRQLPHGMVFDVYLPVRQEEAPA